MTDDSICTGMYVRRYDGSGSDLVHDPFTLCPVHDRKPVDSIGEPMGHVHVVESGVTPIFTVDSMGNPVGSVQVVGEYKPSVEPTLTVGPIVKPTVVEPVVKWQPSIVFTYPPVPQQDPDLVQRIEQLERKVRRLESKLRK